MIYGFFAVLIGIIGLSTGIYSYFFDKKNLISIIILMLFSHLALYSWHLGILILVGFVTYRKLGYGGFAALNMFAAVNLAWFFLNLFSTINMPYYFYVALISVIAICILAIFGIFQSKLKEYLLISSAIQIIFIILDLSVAKLANELSILGTVQIFNYTFAGLVLFLTIGVFARDKKFICQLEGSFFADKWDDIFATIACLSLAGLPAFNMFVSEWALFITSYVFSPMIAILGIFAALLLFVMYYKIVYVLLVGEGKKKYAPRPITLINGVMAVMCVLLGLFPQFQWELLRKVSML